MSEKLHRDAEDLETLHTPAAAGGAPGKATLTSRMHSGRPSELVYRVASAEAAHELADAYGPRDAPAPAPVGSEPERPQEPLLIAHDASPLHPGMRSRAESSLGTSLADVRVHEGPQAAARAGEHGALAVTEGQDIYLGDSVANQPGFILAHEVAHTVQQRGGEVGTQARRVEPSGAASEREADAAASAILAGRTASVSPTAVRTAAFAPETHREATVEGLADGGFDSEEIAAIYQSNWERDFSQGLPDFAAAILAWKNVKMSAGPRGGNPSAEACGAFQSAAYGVVDVDLHRLLTENNESMSGYFSWEHMDNPGEKAAKEADERWAGKSGGLAGYICDGVAYVKEQMLESVNVYRQFHKLAKVGKDIDPWKGAKRPEGYDKTKIETASIEGDTADPRVSRAGLNKETADQAKAAGAKAGSQTPEEAKLWHQIGHHLGRAMHAFEDFWAHSNWVELAKQLNRREKKPENADLLTGTFDFPDKCHALGHKIHAMAGSMQSDFGLMLKVYGRTKASTKLDPNKRSKWWEAKNDHDRAFGALETDSWTWGGEMYDIADATQQAEEMIQRDKGKKDGIKMEDFLCNPAWIAALAAKGDKLIEQGDKDASAHGHGKVAKDQPEGDKDHGGSAAVAAEANRLAFGPLKAIMQEKDPDKAEAAIAKQIGVIDQLIQAPSESHPLYHLVAHAKGDYPAPNPDERAA